MGQGDVMMRADATVAYAPKAHRRAKTTKPPLAYSIFCLAMPTTFRYDVSRASTKGGDMSKRNTSKIRAETKSSKKTKRRIA